MKESDSVLLPMVRERGHDPDAYLATAAALLTGDRVLETWLSTSALTQLSIER
jgi:hypothetical protein